MIILASYCIPWVQIFLHRKVSSRFAFLSPTTCSLNALLFLGSVLIWHSYVPESSGRASDTTSVQSASPPAEFVVVGASVVERGEEEEEVALAACVVG